MLRTKPHVSTSSRAAVGGLSPYSPKCGEGKFYEVHIPEPAYTYTGSLLLVDMNKQAAQTLLTDDKGNDSRKDEENRDEGRNPPMPLLSYVGFYVLHAF